MAAESMNSPRRVRCCTSRLELTSESVCIFQVGGVVDSSAGARRTVATVSSTGDMSVSTLSKSTNEVFPCIKTAPIVRGTSAPKCVGAIEPTRVPCYALLRMRHLSIPCAECSVVISCGKVDNEKSG
jgi:hypothetical protein